MTADGKTRVAAESAARETEFDIRRLGDSLLSIAILLDRDGRVRGWNHEAERLLRVSRNDADGRRLAELPLPFTTPHVREQLVGRDWLHRLVRLDDIPYLDREGRPRVLALTFHPVRNSQGEAGGALVLGRDVTRRAEAESREVERRKLEALETLAGGLAHELNTPVQFIASNLDFLEHALGELEEVIRKAAAAFENSAGRYDGDERLDEVDRSVRDLEPDALFQDVEEAVDAIRHGWKRVAEIVSSMRDFAGVDFSESLVDIRRILRSTARIVEAEQQCDEPIQLELGEDLPAVCGDSGALGRAFYHFLANAVEAAREAGTGRSAIRLTARRAGDSVEVWIDDSGRGLFDSEAARIFDPFYTTKEVGSGSGQGLAIAQGVIRRHGGSIEVGRSDLGGARFVVRLPILPRGKIEVRT